ncbi:response regulator transcription factor [Amycolatopsis sp. TRM77291]
MNRHVPPASNAVVHIIDDDEDVLRSLVLLLRSVGLIALTYPDAMSFLTEFDPAEPAVVIVDVRIPGLSGFQLQERLLEREYPAPIIFCSAHGNVPMSVRAMRAGAVDFLEKPYDPQGMLEVVQAQIAAAPQIFASCVKRRLVREQLSSLTAREREVLRLIIDGLPRQRIARCLGTSVKTVDVHRDRIRTKTETENLGTLVRDILSYQITF